MYPIIKIESLIIFVIHIDELALQLYNPAKERGYFSFNIYEYFFIRHFKHFFFLPEKVTIEVLIKRIQKG